MSSDELVFFIQKNSHFFSFLVFLNVMEINGFVQR